MVQISGKYQHETNENLKEFILGVGMSEEFAVKADAAKANIEVTQNGDEITIVTTYPSKPPTTLTIKLGEEFEDSMPNVPSLMSTAKLERDVIRVNSKKDGKDVGYRTYHFCEKGVRIVMGSNLTPIVCTRTYKRI